MESHIKRGLYVLLHAILADICTWSWYTRCEASVLIFHVPIAFLVNYILRGALNKYSSPAHNRSNAAFAIRQARMPAVPTQGKLKLHRTHLPAHRRPVVITACSLFDYLIHPWLILDSPSTGQDPPRRFPASHHVFIESHDADVSSNH